MDKFVSKWKKPVSSSSSNVDLNDKDSGKRQRVEVELTEDDIVGDPGLRKPIDDYPFAIRDELRRRYLAKGPFQPHDHNFPKSNFGKNMRSFQKAWFTQYDWLEYSIQKDAAFCQVCYLFKRINTRCGDDAFTGVGFKNWKNALNKFKEHEGGLNSPHRNAIVQCSSFRDQRHNVDYVLSQKGTQMEIDYRVRLTAVVKVVRLLLGEGLPFRGHDESKDSIRKGHFLEILDWYCEEKEEVKKVMNLNAPGNNQLTSSKIQKEIINACATEVRKVIINEIGDKFFSILIDEARDSSIREQMAVVVRFVNDRGEVIERFLGVVHVSDTSAHSLKGAIDEFFARNGLSLSRLRGQGYDGASNMRGEFNGLKTLILQEHKHAYYVHCFAHQLQLVVVATSKENTCVSDFMDYLVRIVNLVGASCKRMDAIRQKHYDDLVQRIQSGEISTGTGLNQETSLARPGATRWGSHYRTIKRMLEMWDAVQDVLDTIESEATDFQSRGVARGLIAKSTTFEFVFIAYLLVTILAKTSVLSAALQEKSQNIGKAFVLIRTLKEDLGKFREDGWEEFLESVKEFCSQKGILVPNMEDHLPGRPRSKRQVDDQPKTYLHFFRRDIFLPVVDLILQEMANRFGELSTELISCIVCLDPRDSFASFDRERLLRLAQLYPNDFDDEFKLKEELNHYISIVTIHERAFFSDLQSIGNLAKRMVERKWHTALKLVYRLIELALVLPVATATVERAFSSMKIIKNDLRNKMGEDFLTDSLVCYIEKEIFIKIENEVILQRFQNMASRRFQLPRADLISSPLVGS